MAEFTYRAAVAEGIAREMERDRSVVMIGEDIGAAGGVLVNYVFKLSLEGSKTLTPALTAFLVFYGLCLGTTWWFYLRRNVFAARPSLAYAGV